MHELADVVANVSLNHTHAVDRFVAPAVSENWSAKVCAAPDPAFGATDTALTASGAPYVIVVVTVRAFPAPSRATTVIVLAPEESVIARLQFAVVLPDDVPPEAAVPLTVMLVMPLPPAPLSLAVPLSVMV
jgi:hypothetical protein